MSGTVLSDMSTFLGDVRFSLRLLWKNRGFTAIATIVLALGIGANSAVFTLVNTLMLKPRVGSPQGELISVFDCNTKETDAYRAFSYEDFEELRTRKDVFASLSAHTLTMVGMREGDATRRLFVDISTRDFFETFGVTSMMGRMFTAQEERPGADIQVVIASYPLWQRLGGGSDIGGQSITLNNRVFTVIGVAPRGFGGPLVAITPDAFLPTGVYDNLASDFLNDGAPLKLGDPRSFNLFVAGQLNPGATPESVAPLLKSMGTQMAEANPADREDRELLVTKMSRMSINTSPQDDAELWRLAVVLLGMSFVVMFIASLNLANMLLARNSARAKEFAIRLAIGSSRQRMVRQMMTEGFILSLLGGIGGLALAASSTKLMTASISPLLPIPVAFDVSPDYRIIAATILFCMISTIVFSLGPALRVARTDVIPELKEQAGGLGKRSRFAMRDVLVMGQLALSLVLLTVAALFVRGAVNTATVDPGFTFERGLIINADASLAGRSQDETRLLYQRVADSLRRVPGVTAVSFGSIMPFGEVTESKSVQKPGATVDGASTSTSSMQLGGGAAEGERTDLVASIATSIGTQYFDALGLSVLQDRDFTEAEVFSSEATHVAIIDDVLVGRLFGAENPVGQQLQYRGREEDDPPVVLTVVGVVPGIKHGLLDDAPGAHIYTPLSQDFRSDIHFHIRTAAATADDEAAMLPQLPQLRQAIQSVDSTLPVLRTETRGQFLDRNFMLAIVRLGASIFGVFGAVALILASIGVYGVKAHIVSRRTCEIGIRMALGATPKNVVSLIVMEGVAPSAIGLTVGLVLSLGAAFLVNSYVFQAAPFDPVTTSAALAVLLTATLTASWIPARRATRVQPVTALRY